ncbi:RING-type domain-containing protein [Aphelenchoides besseyi]|nr:RING-type domain-containing protein [Aphelenchoides besseyi]KAI6227104.1 RING-type domain-containing protein [Aphelenchoides besseyi]
MKDHRSDDVVSAASQNSEQSNSPQNDWVHCNACFTRPSNAKPMNFCVTTCGHIICNKCMKKNLGSTTPSKSDTCRACKRRTTFMEVNRHLNRDYLVYFRNPRDLATEFAATIKKVLDFQNYHRTRLQRYRDDDHVRYVKYVKAAKAEVEKMKERQRSITADRDKYKEQNERYRQEASELERKYNEIQDELERMKRLNRKREFASPKPPTSAMPRPKHPTVQNTNFHADTRMNTHLNGNTPLTTPSMGGVPMSTPMDRAISGFENPNDSLNLEKNQSAKNTTGIVSGGINGLSTPALLGLTTPSSKRARENGSRGTSFFKL